MAGMYKLIGLLLTLTLSYVALAQSVPPNCVLDACLEYLGAFPDFFCCGETSNTDCAAGYEHSIVSFDTTDFPLPARFRRTCNDAGMGGHTCCTPGSNPCCNPSDTSCCSASFLEESGTQKQGTPGTECAFCNTPGWVNTLSQGQCYHGYRDAQCLDIWRPSVNLDEAVTNSIGESNLFCVDELLISKCLGPQCFAPDGAGQHDGMSTSEAYCQSGDSHPVGSSCVYAWMDDSGIEVPCDQVTGEPVMACCTAPILFSSVSAVSEANNCDGLNLAYTLSEEACKLATIELGFTFMQAGDFNGDYSFGCNLIPNVGAGIVYFNTNGPQGHPEPAEETTKSICQTVFLEAETNNCDGFNYTSSEEDCQLAANELSEDFAVAGDFSAFGFSFGCNLAADGMLYFNTDGPQGVNTQNGATSICRNPAAPVAAPVVITNSPTPVPTLNPTTSWQSRFLFWIWVVQFFKGATSLFGF